MKSKDGQTQEIFCDTVLFATGRTPNVKKLDLEAAGVFYNENDGIYADKHLATTNKDIFAVGDVLANAFSIEDAKTNPGPGP